MPYETKIKLPSTFWVVTLILVTILTVCFGVDLYVPSLPDIHRSFGVREHLVQLTVSAFIFGNGFTQVIFGALSDAYGRRKLILIGSISFAIFSSLAALAPNIYFLLLMRFCEGVAVAACSGAAKAIIPDVFVGSSYLKVTSLYTTVYCFGLIIAPVIGGYLQEYFGWHAPFYFLACYGVLVFVIAAFRLPETHVGSGRLNVKVLLSQGRLTLKNPVFVGGSLICGLLFSYSAIYLVMAPFLIQNVLGKSAVFYGYIALILGGGAFLGQVVNRISIKMPLKLKVIIVMMCVLILSLCMLVWSLTYSLSVLIMSLPVFIIYAFIAVAYPNVYGTVARLYPKFVGFTVSFCGTITFGMMCLMTVVASFFNAHSIVPLTSLFTVISMVLLLLYFTLFRKS